MRLARNTTKLSMLVLLTLQLSSCGESADHLANEGEYEAVSLDEPRNSRRAVSADYPFEPAKPNSKTSPSGNGSGPNVNPPPPPNGGGNNSTLPPAVHTIDIHRTVWFPQRVSVNAPYNGAGTYVANQNNVLAVKVDFTSPAINFTFHPNASAATLFQAIYKWSSVENQAVRAAHNALITALVIRRNNCLLQFTGPARQQCAVVQSQITNANLNFGVREYDANQVGVEIVDENGLKISNNPAEPYGCLRAGYMGMTMERIDFPFVQRAGQFHLQHCSSVGPDKKWFIRLKVNHCNYTHKVPGRPDVRSADANCQLKFEIFRDTFYFN